MYLLAQAAAAGLPVTMKGRTRWTMDEKFDRQSVLEALDRKAGFGSYADIEPGATPNPVLEALGLADPARGSRIKNLKRDQRVIHKAYDRALSKKVETIFEPPQTIGEAESVLGPNVLGRMPNQVVAAPSVQAFDPFTGGVRDIAAPMPTDLLNMNAPLSPLQATAFEPMVKELAQQRFASPAKPELKTVGGKMFAVNPETAVAQPVAGVPDVVETEKLPAPVVTELMRMGIDPAKSTPPQRQQAAQNLATGETTKSLQGYATTFFNAPVADLGEHLITGPEAIRINKDLQDAGLKTVRAQVGMSALPFIKSVAREEETLRRGMERAATAQAGVDIEMARPLAGESQLYRNPKTMEAAPANLPKQDAIKQGYVPVLSQQVPAMTQIRTVFNYLNEIQNAADKLFRQRTGKAWTEVPKGVGQKALLGLKEFEGDPNYEKMKSALIQITVPMAKLQGDAANIAVAEREMIATAIVKSTDSVQSAAAKIDMIRDALNTTLQGFGFALDQIPPEFLSTKNLIARRQQLQGTRRGGR